MMVFSLGYAVGVWSKWGSLLRSLSPHIPTMQSCVCTLGSNPDSVSGRGATLPPTLFVTFSQRMLRCGRGQGGLWLRIPSLYLVAPLNIGPFLVRTVYSMQG